MHGDAFAGGQVVPGFGVKVSAQAAESAAEALGSRDLQESYRVVPGDSYSVSQAGDDVAVSPGDLGLVSGAVRQIRDHAVDLDVVLYELHPFVAVDDGDCLHRRDVFRGFGFQLDFEASIAAVAGDGVAAGADDPVDSVVERFEVGAPDDLANPVTLDFDTNILNLYYYPHSFILRSILLMYQLVARHPELRPLLLCPLVIGDKSSLINFRVNIKNL